MSGTSLGNFEGHICEDTWRSFIPKSQNAFAALLALIRRFYKLDCPPKLDAPKPVFSTWKHIRKVGLYNPFFCIEFELFFHRNYDL